MGRGNPGLSDLVGELLGRDEKESDQDRSYQFALSVVGFVSSTGRTEKRIRASRILRMPVDRYSTPTSRSELAPLADYTENGHFKLQSSL